MFTKMVTYLTCFSFALTSTTHASMTTNPITQIESISDSVNESNLQESRNKLIEILESLRKDIEVFNSKDLFDKTVFGDIHDINSQIEGLKKYQAELNKNKVEQTETGTLISNDVNSLINEAVKIAPNRSPVAARTFRIRVLQTLGKDLSRLSKVNGAIDQAQNLIKSFTVDEIKGLGQQLKNHRSATISKDTKSESRKVAQFGPSGTNPLAAAFLIIFSPILLTYMGLCLIVTLGKGDCRI